MIKFIVGQKVYFLDQMNYYTEEGVLEETTITNIGRKYIYLATPEIKEGVNKLTLVINKDTYNKQRVFLSTQDYHDYYEKRELVTKISYTRRTLLERMPLEELRSINDILIQYF